MSSLSQDGRAALPLSSVKYVLIELSAACCILASLNFLVTDMNMHFKLCWSMYNLLHFQQTCRYGVPFINRTILSKFSVAGEHQISGGFLSQMAINAEFWRFLLLVIKECDDGLWFDGALLLWDDIAMNTHRLTLEQKLQQPLNI